MRCFIITRFNLLLWDYDKNGQFTWSASWLNLRFLLFETYCLPSVQAQTDQDFLWYCLLDNSTPAKFRNKISEYCQNYPQLIPIYLDKEDTINWLFYVKQAIFKCTVDG